MATMYAEVGTAITTAMGWVGSVLSALTGAEGSLAPLWPLAAMGIGFAVIGRGIGMIRDFAWGF